MNDWKGLNIPHKQGLMISTLSLFIGSDFRADVIFRLIEQ